MLKKIQISRYHWELKKLNAKFSQIILLFWWYNELSSASASYFLLRGVYILVYGKSFSVSFA